MPRLCRCINNYYCLACLVLLLSVMISTFTSQIQIADFDSTIAFIKGIGNNINSLYQWIVHYLSQLSVDAGQIKEAVNTVDTAFTAG